MKNHRLVAAGALIALISSVIAVGALAAPASAAPIDSLYTPDLTTYPNASAAEPRAIMLSHSGAANGTMLSTFDNTVSFNHSDGVGMPPSLTVEKSTDGGTTWAPFSTVSDAVHGWAFARQGMMLELPNTVGSLPAGTILFAGNYESSGETSQDIEVYKSSDHGATWSYLSSCATGGHYPGFGTWEPYLSIDANNNLDCYFSDERHSASGYNQLIGHVTSTDGANTWGSEVYDVAENTGQYRPGMAAVRKMANGNYILVYELPGPVNSQIHYKISTDGVNWGTASNLGTGIATSDGSFLANTPELISIPASSTYPNGMLVLAGRSYLTGAGVNDDARGNVLLVNTNNGAGTWQRAAAPLGLNPPPAPQFDCNNYKPSLLWTGSGTNVLEIASHLIGPGGSDNTGTCELNYATAAVTPAPTTATVVATAIGGSGHPWLLWRYADGHVALSQMTADGSSTVSTSSFGPYTGLTAIDLAVGYDNEPRILWDNSSGAATMWTMSSDGTALLSSYTYGPYTGTVAKSIAVGADNRWHVLWAATDGHINLWTMPSDASAISTNTAYGPISGATATDLAEGADNYPRVLWNYTSGSAALWAMSADGSSMTSTHSYGPYSGTKALSVAAGADNQWRVLWSGADGHINLWTMPADASSITSNTSYGPFTGVTPINIAVGKNNLPRISWTTSAGNSVLTTYNTTGTSGIYDYQATPVAQTPSLPSVASSHWADAWEKPTAEAASLTASSFTCRYPIKITATGSKIRLHLSNIFVSAATSFGGVTIATKGSGGAIVSGSSHAVTVGGSSSFSIAANSQVISDPLTLSVHAGDQYEVSLFLNGSITQYPNHAIGQATSYCTGTNTGDHTADLTTASYAYTNQNVAWINGADVLAASNTKTVVAFGDSITDGLGSTVDANTRWSDDLANAVGASNISVANAGIASNTLTYPDGSAAGPIGLARFNRDVLMQSGISDVILFEGTNDICFNVKAATVIGALQQLAAQAHAAGIRVIGATLIARGGDGNGCLGIATDAAAAAARAQVNAWILSTSDFDAIIDFNSATKNTDPTYAPGDLTHTHTYPNYTQYLAYAYDSGDHTHPNDAGHAAMSSAIDPNQF